MLAATPTSAPRWARRIVAAAASLLAIALLPCSRAFGTPTPSLARRDVSRPNRARPPSRLPMAFDLPESMAEQKQGTEQIIDGILDECTRFSARRPIMVQFDPRARSIWRHWRGTVLSETWRSAGRHAIWAAVVYASLQRYPRAKLWLAGFDTIWGELLAVSTFTLTFFVNESYSCWRKCLDIAYTLQGSMNNFSMALAGCAKRTSTTKSFDTEGTTSTFTEPARKVLTIIARYTRLFNTLSYASFTRSHRPLLTPQGLRRMVKRGLLTDKERKQLVNSRVSATARHNVVLMWVLRIAIEAKKAGHFDGGEGFEQNILQRVEEIRAQGNYMECILRGRMQFGYAHIVQVLVDAIVWLYPLMAFTSGLSFQIGIIGIIALTFTYQGLFDLAKRFLDPFHNESFWSGHDPIRVDTLIAETNAGSRRWMFGLEDMPVPLESIRTGAGDLDSFILPDEGISAEEVAQLEAVEEAAADYFEKQDVGKEAVDEEDEQQTFQEEFEETQAILSAPPGADFVPGLDDVDEVEECAPGTDDPECEPEDNTGDDEEPPMQAFDQYVESLTEEYEDTIRQYDSDSFQ